jgi:hypothetical protein
MVNSLKVVSSRRYGQAGYPKPDGKAAPLVRLVILFLLWEVRLMKFSDALLGIKKSRRSTTGF